MQELQRQRLQILHSDHELRGYPEDLAMNTEAGTVRPRPSEPGQFGHGFVIAQGLFVFPPGLFQSVGSGFVIDSCCTPKLGKNLPRYWRGFISPAAGSGTGPLLNNSHNSQ